MLAPGTRLQITAPPADRNASDSKLPNRQPIRPSYSNYQGQNRNQNQGRFQPHTQRTYQVTAGEEDKENNPPPKDSYHQATYAGYIKETPTDNFSGDFPEASDSY